MSRPLLIAPASGPAIVTIFGGSGFIGRGIVNALARAYPVQALIIRIATRTPAKADPLRQLGEVGQIVPVFCDPSDGASVARALAGSHAVINCIGQLAESRRNPFDRVQGEIPGLIARAIQTTAPDARLIHLSAIGANANSPAKYARSKAAGEGVVRAILPGATILRPSVVFGPEDHFFNRFARLALLLPVLPLPGGGYGKLQPVYVGDIATAVLAALTLPGSAGVTYELGGPASYTLADLLRLMLRVIGRRRELVNIPVNLAMMQAGLLEMLPGKILTRDQVRMLQEDNVADVNAPGFAQLGIMPTAVEAVLPTYLDRFKPRGRFR